MHTTVEFLPLLLHISLLLFFAGLISFLFPISTPLMILGIMLLGLMAATYAYLTVLPILHSDAPYRTPLSTIVWAIFQRLLRMYSRALDPKSTTSSADSRRIDVQKSRIPTMVEVMMWDATQSSYERQERDARAIVWTVKSLTDNDELEPFVNALPDLIWGPHGRRRMYDDMLNLLLDGRDIQLVTKIEGLLHSCDTGLLSTEAEAARRTTCLRALWTIAYFLASDPMRDSFPLFDSSLLVMPGNKELQHYTTSISALVRSACGLPSLKSQFGDEMQMQMQSEFPCIEVVGTYVDNSYAFTPNFGDPSKGRDPSNEADGSRHPAHVAQTMLGGFSRSYADEHDFTVISMVLSNALSSGNLQLQRLQVFWENFQFDPLLAYLCDSAGSAKWPYQFEATILVVEPAGFATSFLHTTNHSESIVERKSITEGIINWSWYTGFISRDFDDPSAQAIMTEAWRAYKGALSSENSGENRDIMRQINSLLAAFTAHGPTRAGGVATDIIPTNIPATSALGRD
ncbi:hypothetical protein C8R43DRAFT_954387 [Mycena crocata]|nr:hypothetical protein C8R43DRAFT_954387 [Mycena crocata]